MYFSKPPLDTQWLSAMLITSPQKRQGVNPAFFVALGATKELAATPRSIQVTIPQSLDIQKFV